MSELRDGKCHNSNDNGLTECGKSPSWMGGARMPDDSIHWSPFCDDCKKNGKETGPIEWWRPY